MKNRDIFQRDPTKITLFNNGVAAVTDAQTDEERRTLRFELEHFVCEGEYQRGLVRILDSYVSNIGQPEQPAAWVSGFFGSGKSHLVKMLQYLWINYEFPDDGATARGLARLPDDVSDLLKEISTLGKRYNGLHAAAGTLGAGAGDSVRLPLLGIVFKSAGLPEGYPQARFCLWLKKNGLYNPVCSYVESRGREFKKELNDLYVSPLISKALLEADPHFASDEGEAKKSLREQFPKPKDVTTNEFVSALQEALALNGQIPCTVVILDEVQQYIGDDTGRSYDVQEVVEACSKKFGGKLLFVGTGQTALAGTPALQRLQGRFTVNVELSDTDVETVTRRVVLAKRSDRIGEINSILELNAGEIDRQLNGTKIGPRSEDKFVINEDYPLLPTRRRFWEHALRALDKAGTAGQLRTQLRIVYDAIKHTAEDPLGTVVPADFLFDEISANLLQSGVLLREINEIIQKQKDGSENGDLKHRILALVFMIRKRSREAGSDTGVRATAETLADLMVRNLSSEGTSLRMKIPQLLDELVEQGTLIKVENEEYSLQTRESSEWENEFRTRMHTLLNDPARMSTKRGQLLNSTINDTLRSIRLVHGRCKEPRELHLHFGLDQPEGSGQSVPVWIRDGWGIEEKTVIADARAAGTDSPIIFIFIPKYQAEALGKLIAQQNAAQETLNFKGTPTTKEGIEARQSMETRLVEATNSLKSLLNEIIDEAKVIQGGGNECVGLILSEKVRDAAEASLDRMYYEFKDADDARWSKAIERARMGDETPFQAVDFTGKTEDHPVCSALLSFVGSGKKGKETRDHFSNPPYGWSRDAIDAGLISLFASGHLRATQNGVLVKSGQLDQGKISVTDFRVESVTLDTRQKIKLRKLFQDAGIPFKPNEESQAAGLLFQKLADLAAQAGGEPPLPQVPQTAYISDLQSLSGNEQLTAIYGKYDQIESDLKAWTQSKERIQKREPAFDLLNQLMKHADTLPFAKGIKPQIDSIIEERRLLDDPDPIPSLIKKVVDGLRAAITAACAEYEKTYSERWEALQGSDSWAKLNETQRQQILAQVGLKKTERGGLGTDNEVLASLDRISLESWSTRTAALSQQFAEARKLADKMLEPKIQHIKLQSEPLRTPEDVKAWVKKTEQEILGKLKNGPVVIS